MTALAAFILWRVLHSVLRLPLGNATHIKVIEIVTYLAPLHTPSYYKFKITVKHYLNLYFL